MPAPDDHSPVLLPLDGRFTDRFRRAVRRQPGMGDSPLAAAALLDEMVPLAIPAVVFGALLAVWLTPERLTVFVLVVCGYPYGSAHIMGVRHRWWALAAAVASGGVVYLVTWVLLGGVGLQSSWASVVVSLAAAFAGIWPYAAVTRVPPRRTLDAE